MDDADDGEDEENLDRSDKETADIEAPEGQCLLPRLKELNLMIRPRKELLLKVVRSRWRPVSLAGSDHVNLSRNDDSTACVCLQTVRITHPAFPRKKTLTRLKALHESLRWFKKQGMEVEVSE
ncbi:hypothetical protein BT96DRAFT_984303 [Gymnopus androsaceus JB14]|uniref:Uncharacterized protein n=1 Tax=Gymnopus androsaceus JB14 TaxID=1447944 RepID=A0A6A4IMC1_9AGAR|nr:hypothetical protein BT96DRAFT_984303 [Gymnopus androsaceus JB14]